MGISVLNVRYASFQKSKNYNELMEFGLDLAVALDPDDELLVAVWPSYLLANGLDPSRYSNRQARAEFIAKLPANKVFTCKGIKASPSKFFSINKGWRYWRCDLPVNQLAYGHLCNEKNWVTHWEELFIGVGKYTAPAAIEKFTGAHPAAAVG